VRLKSLFGVIKYLNIWSILNLFTFIIYYKTHTILVDNKTIITLTCIMNSGNVWELVLKNNVIYFKKFMTPLPTFQRCRKRELLEQ